MKKLLGRLRQPKPQQEYGFFAKEKPHHNSFQVHVSSSLIEILKAQGNSMTAEEAGVGITVKEWESMDVYQKDLLKDAIKWEDTILIVPVKRKDGKIFTFAVKESTGKNIGKHYLSPTSDVFIFRDTEMLGKTNQ